jgi:aminoglycoside phosphotransferase (APT) family kinase protein
MPGTIEVGLIESLIAPALAGGEVATVSPVDGGFINRVYRVVPSSGREALTLRIYASGNDAFIKERSVLERVRSSVPAPDVVFASEGRADFRFPFIVYRWIDGLTLNECRRREPASVMVSLAEPLGRLAACVATVEPSADLCSLTVGDALRTADERLRYGPARARLGPPLAEQLRARFDQFAPRLEEADRTHRLAHGDFGGRNILVTASPGGGSEWRIAALLDWEQAFAGATLWDVGSFFRYTRRYTADFRERFAIGYREVGGTLAHDWHVMARLLDGTRLVAILSEARDLPIVFDECRELILALTVEE